MKAGVVDTYDGNINSGASADDLKKALANYADGMKPMPPNAKILYQLIGSASSLRLVSSAQCASGSPISPASTTVVP